MLLAVAFAACGDDDGTAPPATPPAPTGLTAVRSTDGLARVTLDRCDRRHELRAGAGRRPAPGTFDGDRRRDLPRPATPTPTSPPAWPYSYHVAAVNANGTGSFSSAVIVEPGTAGAAVGHAQRQHHHRSHLSADTLYTLSGLREVRQRHDPHDPAGHDHRGRHGGPGQLALDPRGAQIDAQGTAAAPIVFTSGKPAGSSAPGDWGGSSSSATASSTAPAPCSPRGRRASPSSYSGGTDNADNSGTLRYVRIEFAGYDVSGGAGQELNSLSIYAVGSGTTLEYVQSLAGLDDSFEWWGGAVDGRYLVSYEAGDDHFDWTEGYRGRNQFLIGFQSVRLDPAADAGHSPAIPQGFEADGCNGVRLRSRFRQPAVLDPGVRQLHAGRPPAPARTSRVGDLGMVLRRGTGGYLTNGIVARWQGQGLSVRDPETNDLLTADSLNVVNLLLAENAVNYDDGRRRPTSARRAVFAADNHVHGTDPAASLFTSLTARLRSTGPRLRAPPLQSGAGTVVIPTEYTGDFFGGSMPNTTYFGAADPAGAKWWQGWTNYATQ